MKPGSGSVCPMEGVEKIIVIMQRSTFQKRKGSATFTQLLLLNSQRYHPFSLKEE